MLRTEAFRVGPCHDAVAVQAREREENVGRRWRPNPGEERPGLPFESAGGVRWIMARTTRRSSSIAAFPEWGKRLCPNDLGRLSDLQLTLSQRQSSLSVLRGGTEKARGGTRIDSTNEWSYWLDTSQGWALQVPESKRLAIHILAHC